ncbi:MAG: hypothetical protein RLZZ57_1701 [Pseudomonadota bacterium]|jgi:hypothetical protein
MNYTNLHLKKEEISQLIVNLQQVGCSHKIPLLRALRDNRIGLCEIMRGTDFLDESLLLSNALPMVCVVGDDDFCSTGPSAYPVAAELIRRSKCRFIHGAGGEAFHYDAAVLAAEKFGNCLIIETSSAWVDSWLALTKCIIGELAPRTLVIKVKEGAHPVMGTRQ